MENFKREERIKMFTLLLMIFMHIFDDFYLQGWLATGKQKKWWRNLSEYSDLYKYDYIMALLAHSFSWAFMTMLPIFYMSRFNLSAIHILVFTVNIVIHAIVDDLKTNRFRINLIQDQSIHLIQIVATFIIFRY